MLGSAGVEKVIEMQLDDNEKAMLEKSAKAVADVVEHGPLLLGERRVVTGHVVVDELAQEREPRGDRRVVLVGRPGVDRAGDEERAR